MSEKLLSHLPALTNVVRRIAVEAGHATLEYFDEAGFRAFETKGDGSPVTIADRASETVIIKALRDLLPGVPIISEESTTLEDAAAVDAGGHVWLVDPLDGTKAFVAGDPDYCVNIALTRAGRAVLGVIYAPVRGELFAGSDGAAAIRWTEENNREKEAHVRTLPPEGVTVTTSAGADRPDTNAYLSQYKVARIIKRRSALKFCSIAMGKADLYVRFGACGLWDVAAGDAILRAAGGEVVDHMGAPLRYDPAATLDAPPFIAATADFLTLASSF